MSLNQLTLDQRKPWLNVRVNNLTVDGTYTGPGGGGGEFVVVRDVMPNPAVTLLPFTVNATLLPSMIPVANSWYSLQYLVCLSLPDNTKAKVSDFNVLAYVAADFTIRHIGTNEWQAEFPALSLPGSGGPKYALDANNETGVPYQVRIIFNNQPVGNPPLAPSVDGYNYSFEISDVRRLTSN